MPRSDRLVPTPGPTQMKSLSVEGSSFQQRWLVRLLQLELPPTVLKAVLSLGVFVFFILSGIVEEYLFAVLPGFRFGWFMTFVEMVLFVLFAITEQSLLRVSESVLLLPGQQLRPLVSPFTAAFPVFLEDLGIFQRRAPLWSHGVVGIAMCLSRGLTNMSLQYLVYPTQVMFKSLKLISVMIGAFVWLGKRYSLRKIAAALLLVLSVCVFSWGEIRDAEEDLDATSSLDALEEESVGVKTTMFGVMVVLISLVMDSAHSNSQEVLLRRHEAGIIETMLFTNLFSAAFAFVINVVQGELQDALAFCLRNPSIWFLFFLRGLSIYCGVKCFIQLIQRFGVVLATVVTTLRKIATIIISILLFPAGIWNMDRFLGLLLFVGSVFLNHEPKK